MLDRGAGVRRLPHLLDQRRERIDHAIALVPDQRRERALLVAKELVQGLLGNCRDRSQVVRGRADVAVVDEHVKCALKDLPSLSGLPKPTPIIEWLKDEYGIGRGHAMAMVHVITKGDRISAKHVGSSGTHADAYDRLWLDDKDSIPEDW